MNAANGLRSALLALAAGCAPARVPPAPPAEAPPPPLTVRDPGGSRYFYLEPGTTVPLLVGGAGEEEVMLVSRDPGVARVDPGGRVTAVAEGRTWIVAHTARGERTDSLQVGVHCTLELRYQYATRDTTLRVGESFVASLELHTCGGHVRIPEVLTWRARDPRIVQVDPVTGHTRALAPGETWVDVTSERYSMLEGVRVVVRQR